MFSKKSKKEDIIKNDAEDEEESHWTTEEGKLVVDVYETDRDLVIQAAIAGIKTEELDIALENDMMIIKGERIDPNASKNKKYFIKECYFGPFSREIILPREIDTSKIKAEIKDGILTIKMPKIERAKSKRINLGENKTRNKEEEEYEDNDEEDEDEEEEEIEVKPIKRKQTSSKVKKPKDNMIYEDEEEMEQNERNDGEEDEEYEDKE